MIEIGSKWKSEKGNVYEVVDMFEYVKIYCIVYRDNEGELYVIKEDHFFEAFKPYEPQHEAKYAFMFDGELNVTPMYLTKDEACKAGYTEEQRIKISTRERKQ